MKAALYTNESSLAQLTAVYNGIKGVKPVKRFTCSKTEAIAKIEKAIAAVPKSKGGLTVVATYGEESTKTSKAGPRTGVCALMTQLFADGLSPKDVFAKIQATLPEAKTSLKAVYWMRSYLRSQGAQV